MYGNTIWITRNYRDPFEFVKDGAMFHDIGTHGMSVGKSLASEYELERGRTFLANFALYSHIYANNHSLWGKGNPPAGRN